MKQHIYTCKERFDSGCKRAQSLCVIFEYIKSISPQAINLDDILRSSILLSVSSFDLYIHDIFRLEICYRLQNKIPVSNFKIPFNAAIIDGDKIEIVNQHIRNENSYKSFVSPDKLAECLRILIDTPWDRISGIIGCDSSQCKMRLKQIVDLRNRIAHEADVNPNYSGIELWPIYANDVRDSISFIRRLGDAIGEIINDN